MKILVTGVAGFIGSNFCELATLEHDVLGIDALTYAGNLANINHLSDITDRFTFLKIDIRDGQGVRNALRIFKPEAIVNFAAESHVDRSIQDASPFISTNVGGVQVLLDAMKEVCQKSARFIQVSTDEVYGSMDNGHYFEEDSKIKPSSPYAASKAAADLLALSYAHTFGMNVIVTRCSNNYGRRQFPEKLIPLAITNMLLDKKVPVYGDGKQERDWIHVIDHCRGIMAAIQSGESGEVYNFGTGRGTDNLSIIKKLFKIIHSKKLFPVSYKQFSEVINYVTDRPGHDRVYIVNASKARSELKWRALTNFNSGLAETVSWYASNSDWWGDVRSGDYLKYYEKQYGAA